MLGRNDNLSLEPIASAPNRWWHQIEATDILGALLKTKSHNHHIEFFTDFCKHLTMATLVAFETLTSIAVIFVSDWVMAYKCTDAFTDRKAAAGCVEILHCRYGTSTHQTVDGNGISFKSQTQSVNLQLQHCSPALQLQV